MVTQNPTSPALAHPEGDDRNTRSVAAFKKALENNLYYLQGQGVHTASDRDMYLALALTIRNYLIDGWRKTVDTCALRLPKFVYYLSAEYLPGRQITQNMFYTDSADLARQAMADYGFDLDQLVALEPEPGLGNGGLGRLVACFLDSLATLDIPCVAYGIRYEFGIFKQSFVDGWQQEGPDEWLFYGNPWEFAHPEHHVEVSFGGYTEHDIGEQGRFRVRWRPAQTLLGEPYHTLVPGYKAGTVNMLRLWRARATREFDFQLFDVGDYERAVEQKNYWENLTKVLYPNDTTPQGRELRLMQQYFFVACSIQDIIRRFRAFHSNWRRFPEKTVVQLNDTHPVIAIPELMRVLVDQYELAWEQAWEITRRTFAYTIHTLMPEALEKWPIALFERLLPRHMEIIYEINQRFLDQVRTRFPNEPGRVARMSIIEEYPERQVRMAHLGVIGCFSVNGVAELQSNLLKERTLPDFYGLWPEKFNNKTNGVTPRRFLRLANPRLATLITATIGDGWLTDLARLGQLEPYANDAGFRQAWRAVKRQNKAELAALIQERTGVAAGPDTLFDVMVKRLHEYKRQLLQALHIITLYNRIKTNPALDLVARTCVFGAKAAPGYYMAKLIIKLINSVGEVVNRDADVRDRLKVAFVPNFNVTVGERIYPAADLSEQISLAGKEASGTGNMKFALNGALTIGTLDGANIEIRDRVGPENFFLFGMTAEEVLARQGGYDPPAHYNSHAELKQALDDIASGRFSNGNRDLFRPIVESLLQRDEFMLLADYPSYVACQDRVARAYVDHEQWTRMSILNVARCGFFSSDRTVQQYCDDIWHVQPVRME